MSLAVVYSRAAVGISAPLVSVEVHLSNGLPSLSIVGLPETEVKESKDRVRSALLNSRFDFPAGRITINLAPAELPKEGGRFDLAIALGILAASGQVPGDRLEGYEFLGELALSGALRPNRGVLPAAIQAARAGRSLVLAADNADEAALTDHPGILPATDLLSVSAHLHGSQALARHSRPLNGDQTFHGPDDEVGFDGIERAGRRRRAQLVARHLRGDALRGPQKKAQVIQRQGVGQEVAL